MIPKYYESHITIEPVFDERLYGLKMIAHARKFKVAELLMQKRANDIPERSKYDTFITGHSQSYDDLERRMRSCVDALRNCGFEVWRTKIEAVLLDEHYDA